VKGPLAVTSQKILVSDFDGTMTQHDFYQLAVESLLPPGTPDYWIDYRAGAITHFEALRRYFAAIRASEEDVLKVVARMQLDPGLGPAVRALRAAGWDVVVTSAGCAWYIDRLLSEAGVNIEVYANPGRFKTGEGLLMEMPKDSPFRSPLLGVDKTKIVQTLLNEGRCVAFAGDGFPDVEPARLVPDDLRFARGDLAKVMQKEGLPFQRYERWSEIATKLVSRKQS
jgi:2-hydroxy-3-keto-5-methylthiopentenyl-1-phosphate phosphatase